MELHGLFGICWCVLNGLGKLATGNYEKEQVMVANGGSRIERSDRIFERLQKEANESLGSFWCVTRSLVPG
jgi:hypothetical protein